MTRQTITQGRYTVTINPNCDGFFALITRDGQCLHGIPGRHYADKKRAQTGAKSMFKKAGA
jgi:hypothetical protein